MASENEPAQAANAGKAEKRKIPEKLVFKKIADASRAKMRGTMTFEKNILKWHADTGNRSITIPVDEIEEIQWSPLGKDCRLRIYMIGDSQASFRGFSANDFNSVSPYCKLNYGKTPEILQINTSGHNYGNIDFKGSVLRHFRGNRCTFEIPLTSVSQSVIQGKNEVSLLFHEDDTVGHEDEFLTEMRIYVPPKEEELEDGEKTALEEMNEEIIERAGIRVNASDIVTKLENMMFTVPRGKYDIEFYHAFFKLHGSSFNYKIMYQNVTKLFLMAAHDRAHHLFIIGLDPPIRQGRTPYHYLIIQMKSDDQVDVELNLDDKEIKASGDTISKNMTGSKRDIVWRLFKSLSKRKVAVPSKFKSSRQVPCISCSLKATFGHLYLFKKSFFFVHKPPTYLRHDQISSLEFARLQNSGTGRVFDVVFTMKDDSTYTFTNIDKEEFSNLSSFIQESGLRISNLQESQAASRSRGRSSATDMSLDPYAQSLVDEAMEEEDDDDDEDEDYQAGESSSSVADDYEEVQESSGDDEGEKQKKKSSAKKKASVRKQEDDNDDEVGNDDKSVSVKKEKSKAPKAARSAYYFYQKANRKKLMEENPDKKHAEIGKLLGEQWKELTEEDKKPYEEKAQDDKARYKKEKAKFHEENPDQTSSRKRKRKDKNAPKKAKSAFILFSQEARKKIKEENPDKSFGDIGKLVGAQWKELSAEERQPYIEMSKKDKVRATEERAKYAEEHKDDAESDEGSSKKKRKRKKLPGQPKRAKSAYLLFTQKNRAKITEMNPGKQPKEMMSILAENWRALADDAKEEYNELAKKDKVRYEKEMAAFKTKQKGEKAKVDEEKDEGDDDDAGDADGEGNGDADADADADEEEDEDDE